MNAPRRKTFEDFWEIVERELHGHPVIVNNPFCKWFKKGGASRRQIADLFEQFAVFSKWFLLAQLLRTLNASDLEAETRSRHILVNELGVGILPDGTAENQPFKTEWAHINWLRETARPLDLDPQRLGSWESASPATKAFIKGLEDTYGSKDGEIGRGASYAIETWAAWGIGQGAAAESGNFWKELIVGIELYNQNIAHGARKVPLDFFQFHFDSEKGHGDNVLEEVRHSYFKPGFDAKKFLKGGRQALDAIYTFWAGLDKSRRELG
ncbi:MAG: hypothetical protein HY580_04245 [Nitrospinae bacterium]|nr:hypothetical protein [Nitrospinota bacterium]